MIKTTSLASGIALGSAGVLMMSVLTGCESPQQKQETVNKFLVIEQQANGKYIVVEEMPTDGPSRAIIREKDANGNTVERFMNEDEMRTLAEQEYAKVQDGTSETVSEGGGAGMGIAGTILAAAAGAMMGNMIANSLMNNKNFSKNAASSNKSAYSRSAASRASKSSSSKKSFFGKSSRSSSSGSRSFGS